ncbi:hypothetical protein [Vibrio campbellii]|uniref:hypothetical protein n=1 Tax=Vibrio campbellii TaxID=680 RepID=UPI001F1E417C|nr:hypothetical protein [Vibrio campbellii]MCE7732492.1 hypothetical protein [Vibrio campbellii]
MKIQKKNMRSLNALYAQTQDYSQLTLAVPVEQVSQKLLEKIGFKGELIEGQSILPAGFNSRTRENLDGKCHIRKDLPKEKYTVEWDITWEDWGGNSHSRTIWFDRERNARSYDEAFSCYLTIISINGKQYISADDIIKIDANERLNLHICNLMLSCFGYFEVFDADLMEIKRPERKVLNWDILPPGEYPWNNKSSIKQLVSNKLSGQKKAKFERRTGFIEKLKPDFVASGRGGFNHYFIYGFEARNTFILESINDNNATYVFSDDWRELSQLTKAEIIQGDLAKNRIIHNASWETEVRKAVSVLEKEN